MEKFAYIDKSGIMHIVEKRETAEKYKGEGKVVATKIKAKYGYPVNEEEDGVIVYAEDVMKLEANGHKIAPIAKLAALYRECKA